MSKSNIPMVDYFALEFETITNLMLASHHYHS